MLDDKNKRTKTKKKKIELFFSNFKVIIKDKPTNSNGIFPASIN